MPTKKRGASVGSGEKDHGHLTLKPYEVGDVGLKRDRSGSVLSPGSYRFSFQECPEGVRRGAASTAVRTDILGTVSVATEVCVWLTHGCFCGP
jgi:hypothetical protein